MKVVCRNKNIKVINQWAVKTAHIYCAKDTYEVLRSIIAPHLNSEINELQHDENNNFVLMKYMKKSRIKIGCILAR